MTAGWEEPAGRRWLGRPGRATSAGLGGPCADTVPASVYLLLATASFLTQSQIVAVALKRSFIHLSFAQSIKSSPGDDGELGRHLPREFIPSYLVPSYTTLTHIESDCITLNRKDLPT